MLYLYWAWRHKAGMVVQVQSFITSTLGGGERSASCPGRFFFRKKDSIIHRNGGWVGRRVGSGLFWRRKTLLSARIQTSDLPTSSLVSILSCTSLPHEVPRYDGTGLGFYTCSWQWQFLLSWPSFRAWFWGSFLRAVQNCVCLSDPCPMRRPTACSEQFIGRGSETLMIFDEEYKLWCS
jgi:hypothetical protein